MTHTTHLVAEKYLSSGQQLKLVHRINSPLLMTVPLFNNSQLLFFISNIKFHISGLFV